MREEGLSIVTVVCGSDLPAARAFLRRAELPASRALVHASGADVDGVLAAYRLRCGRRPADTLLFVGSGRELRLAVEVSRREPTVPVAVCATIDGVLAALLGEELPTADVAQLLQGIVALEPPSRGLIEQVVERRRLAPVLRSAFEGLLYYVLECRRETAGRFVSNRRVKGDSGASFEVDFLAVDEGLILEIDGVQHERPDQQRRDGDKQRDLEAAGYGVLRVSTDRLVNEPWVVWDLVQQTLARRFQSGSAPSGASVYAG